MSQKIKPGVATGATVGEIFHFAKEKGFAIPAINCTGTDTINSVMEAAREVNSPVIIQFSNGGAAFIAGKALPNDAQQASIAGAIAGAKHVHTLAEMYGVPVILQTLKDNIEICKRYLERMSKMGMTLEIELGITGGEEDGVDHSDVHASKLYTQPEDVAYAYEELLKISPNFTIAASFGNVHGVYKPGNVVLKPTILRDSQEYIQKKYGTGKNPVNFVFHGGSGSSLEEIREAITYGVVKMNIDTDTQFAFMEGIRNYMEDKKAYLQSQIGNPEGPEAPNKKHYDPRVWLRKGEETLIARIKVAFSDLKCIDVLK